MPDLMILNKALTLLALIAFLQAVIIADLVFPTEIQENIKLIHLIDR